MIVVDVSQIIRWQGRLTGVPRVEYELAVRFMDEADAVCVSWDGAVFRVVDMQAMLQEKEESGGVKGGSAAPSTRHTSSAANTVKRAILRIPFAKRALHRARSLRQRQIMHAEWSAKPEYSFTAADILFIGQGMWNDDSYIAAVEAAANVGVKVVHVVHDMLPVLKPQYSGHSTEWLKNYASRIYPVSSHILSDSKNTSRDLKAWLKGEGLHVPHISEFRLGDNFQAADPVQPQGFSLSEDFILCVGTIEARKNHMLLYYVYKLAASRGLSLPKLVIVGRRGWHTENVMDLILNDPDTREIITVLENASDRELSWLYDHCRFTVYPSFYEGWGLPIAESIYYGKPCVASNTSSMPEVAEDAAIYFNPASTDELLDIMMRLTNEAELKSAERKVKSYRGMTWDDTYKKVIAIIREM